MEDFAEQYVDSVMQQAREYREDNSTLVGQVKALYTIFIRATQVGRSEWDADAARKALAETDMSLLILNALTARHPFLAQFAQQYRTHPFFDMDLEGIFEDWFAPTKAPKTFEEAPASEAPKISGEEPASEVALRILLEDKRLWWLWTSCFAAGPYMIPVVGRFQPHVADAADAVLKEYGLQVVRGLEPDELCLNQLPVEIFNQMAAGCATREQVILLLTDRYKEAEEYRERRGLRCMQ